MNFSLLCSLFEQRLLYNVLYRLQKLDLDRYSTKKITSTSMQQQCSRMLWVEDFQELLDGGFQTTTLLLIRSAPSSLKGTKLV